MKILVTGATGFIGSNVINALLDFGHIIVATGVEDKAIMQSRFSWISKVSYIQKDLNVEEDNFFDFFGKPDLLIHLSWEGLPNYKEMYHIERNLILNYKFIKNLVTHGLKKVVCIGTCFEYGLQEGCLSEDMSTNPNTSYGLAKDSLRRFIEELQKHQPFNLKWLRLFYLYGKNQNPKSLFSQLERAIENKEDVFNMSGGEQRRDFLPVNKAAEYIVSVSLQDKINGIINICSGTSVSVREFVENYLKENNLNIKLNFGYYPYNDYEPMSFWGDNRKLTSLDNAAQKRSSRTNP